MWRSRQGALAHAGAGLGSYARRVSTVDVIEVAAGVIIGAPVVDFLTRRLTGGAGIAATRAVVLVLLGVGVLIGAVVEGSPRWMLGGAAATLAGGALVLWIRWRSRE